MTEYTADEMMTVTAARTLRAGMTCFVGIGLPSAAANLTGAGPQRIITGLGVLEPDPRTREFVLTGVYAGVSVSEVRSRTGWELGVSADLAEIPAPGAAELTALRALGGRS